MSEKKNYKVVLKIAIQLLDIRQIFFSMESAKAEMKNQIAPNTRYIVPKITKSWPHQIVEDGPDFSYFIFIEIFTTNIESASKEILAIMKTNFSPLKCFC